MLAYCDMAPGWVSLLSLNGYQQCKGCVATCRDSCMQGTYGAVKLSAADRQWGMEEPMMPCKMLGRFGGQPGVYLRSC